MRLAPGTRAMVFAVLLVALLGACQGATPPIPTLSPVPSVTASPAPSLVLRQTTGDYWLYALMGMHKVSVVTPAGVVGLEPPEVTIKVGASLTIVSGDRGRGVPVLSAAGAHVVRIIGSRIQGLGLGTVTVSAVGIDYCADQKSHAETCPLLTIVVQS
jgi:hypothetical protein